MKLAKLRHLYELCTKEVSATRQMFEFTSSEKKGSCCFDKNAHFLAEFAALVLIVMRQ